MYDAIYIQYNAIHLLLNLILIVSINYLRYEYTISPHNVYLSEIYSQ